MKHLIAVLILLTASTSFAATPRAKYTSNATQEWSNFKGLYPRNAVKFGRLPSHDNVHQFVCRAFYKGAWHPGRSWNNTCYYGYGGKEIVTTKFQIMAALKPLMRETRITKNSVVAGLERGQKRAVCTGVLKGDTHIGKTVSGKCFVGLYGKEHHLKIVHVLAYNPKKSVTYTRPFGVKCAKEGAQCKFISRGRARIYYGSGKTWTKHIIRGGGSRTIPCSNKVFGDPTPGVVKSCFVVAVNTNAMPIVSKPIGARCATEGKNCQIFGPAMMYYGAGKRWTYKRVTKSTACNNAVFGDPNKGVIKSCVVKPMSKNTLAMPRGGRCAKEGGQCIFKSTGMAYVYYGSGQTWRYKAIAGKGARRVACNNAFFGDPTPGVAKFCFVKRFNLRPRRAGKPQGRRCATENKTCRVTGPSIVYYGAGNRWVSKEVVRPVPCTNGFFGDPNKGVVKSCFVKRIQ